MWLVVCCVEPYALQQAEHVELQRLMCIQQQTCGPGAAGSSELAATLYAWGAVEGPQQQQGSKKRGGPQNGNGKAHDAHAAAAASPA